MATALELPGGRVITYESAAEKDENIIARHHFALEGKKLQETLWEQKETIETLVAHHLGLMGQGKCHVMGRDTWMQGSFNVCIPVEVAGDGCQKLIMRCPMPHKLAETRYPGTVDEKIACEAGTYAWMQEHCPEVRIPHLFGFGFTDHRHFTHARHRPFYLYALRSIQRYICALISRAIPSYYMRNSSRRYLHTGYLLLEYIESSTGKMLSTTWSAYRHDQVRMNNLFRGLARLILSMARIPQPRIGAFKFQDDGTVTLTNRPLTCATAILENEGAPRVIQRSDTYVCTEAFVSDMLTFHDNRFLSQPNATYSEEDCRGQMAVKALLRTVSHHYLEREHRNGPFALQFTDFHPSNILVDDEWNFKCALDFEFMCSLPREMLRIPAFLGGKSSIEEIEHEEFETIQEQFMAIFEEEEGRSTANVRHCVPLTKTTKAMWDSKGVWFWYCLDSTNAMYFLLESHICPDFSSRLSSKIEESVSPFWCKGSEAVVRKKLADKRQYNSELWRCFNGSRAPKPPEEGGG